MNELNLAITYSKQVKPIFEKFESHQRMASLSECIERIKDYSIN